MQPRFNFGLNNGNYPCCDAKALRFSTGRKQKGCTARNHIPTEDAKSAGELELLLKYFELVCEPFEKDQTIEVEKEKKDASLM